MGREHWGESGLMKYLFQARMAQSRKDKFMDLQAWRASRKTTKTLPSGLEVILKRVSLLDLAMNGDIPNTMAGMVDDMIDQTKTVEVKATDFKEYGDVINLVVKACVLEPAVADESDETHLGLREMPMEDRLEIFDWANEGVEQLHPFRAGEKEPVAAAQPGDGLRGETVEAA